MVEINTEKFRQDFNRLDNNLLDTLDNAYKEYDKVKSLSEDLSYYYVNILSNFCHNILLKNDLFVKKYPSSTIHMIDTEEIEIESCHNLNGDYVTPNCRINFKEKMFSFSYFDDRNMDVNEYVKSSKEAIIEIEDKIKKIKETRIDINYRKQLLKDSLSALKSKRLGTALHLLFLSQTVSDERINQIINAFKAEINGLQNSIKDYNNTLSHFENNEWIKMYKNYNNSFKTDLRNYLQSFNFQETNHLKDEYIPYCLFNNYINFVDFYIFKNEEIINDIANQRINKHSYRMIDKL